MNIEKSDYRANKRWQTFLSDVVKLYTTCVYLQMDLFTTKYMKRNIKLNGIVVNSIKFYLTITFVVLLTKHVTCCVVLLLKTRFTHLFNRLKFLYKYKIPGINLVNTSIITGQWSTKPIISLNFPVAL